jgi:hypothetical protein
LPIRLPDPRDGRDRDHGTGHPDEQEHDHLLDADDSHATVFPARWWMMQKRLDADLMMHRHPDADCSNCQDAAADHQV